MLGKQTGSCAWDACGTARTRVLECIRWVPKRRFIAGNRALFGPNARLIGPQRFSFSFALSFFDADEEKGRLTRLGSFQKMKEHHQASFLDRVFGFREGKNAWYFTICRDCLPDDATGRGTECSTLREKRRGVGHQSSINPRVLVTRRPPVSAPRAAPRVRRNPGQPRHLYR